MKYIDLHVHSTASDGSLTPAEVVDHAVELSLSAFALTDHDTLAGIAQAKEQAALHRNRGVSIEVCSGVEISAAYKSRDIHILGLLVDEENELLRRTLKQAVEERENRNQKICRRFAALGISICMEELHDENPEAVITRAHFAKALIKKGIVAGNAEAFDRYLGLNAPCYVPREYISPEQAISLIKRAGGVPVLAHPLLYELAHEELLSLIERLKAAGLAGLEVIYSANRGQDEAILRSIASRYSLLMTGGSDFHGTAKPSIELGIGKGNLKIPYSVLTGLQEEKKKEKGIR